MEEEKNTTPNQNLKVLSNNLLDDGQHQNHQNAFTEENAYDDIDNLQDNNEVLKDDSILNDCDEIADQIQIQTKYCKSAEATSQNCFNKSQFRYTGQIIEVPPEQFDEIQAKFKKDGLTKVELRKGNVSFKTAKAIAKSGTVKGLTYDAVQGVQLSVKGFGISAACLYAYSIWSGKTDNKVFIDSFQKSAEIFEYNTISRITTQQFANSTLNGFGQQETQKLLQSVLSSSNFTTNANNNKNEGQKKIVQANTQLDITQMVQGQAVYAIGMIIAQTEQDFRKVLEGKISGKQLAKNMFCNVATAGGGVAFSVYGTAIGGPVAGIIGGIVGGVVSQMTAKKIADIITSDDLEEMAESLRQVIQELQKVYMLLKEEINQLIDDLQTQLLQQEFLQKMFEQQQNSLSYARQNIKPYFKAAVSNRIKVNIELAQVIDN